MSVQVSSGARIVVRIVFIAVVLSLAGAAPRAVASEPCTPVARDSLPSSLYQADLRGRCFFGVGYLKGVDLGNANLAGANLAGANLTGANLTLANLTGADLTAADLSLSTLQAANLTGAVLDRARIFGVRLDGANLSKSSLIGIRSGQLNTTFGGPTGLSIDWRIQCGFLLGPSADLRGADMSGCRSAAGTGGSTLEGVNLSGADLGGARLSGITLSRATIEGAKFAGADLAGLQAFGITGEPLSLPAGWKLVNGFLVGPGADLRTWAYLNAGVSGDRCGSVFSLIGADLRGVSLEGALLGGVSLDRANLDGVDLRTALMGCVSARDVTGVPSALPFAWKLIDGSLVGPGSRNGTTDLSGLDLRGIDLRAWQGPFAGTPAALPSGWRLVPSGWNPSFGYLVGPGIDLGRSNLSGADLSATNLAGVSLAKANLEAANLSGLDLRGTGLLGANLKGANLRNADLRGTVSVDVDMSGADLTGAKLGGTLLYRANLNGTVLSGAEMPGVRAVSLAGTPASLPAGWRLVSGLLIGPGADLTSSSLVGLNLDGVDLSEVLLTGVSSGGISGLPSALPTSWSLVNGYLIGPGADLRGAALAGANLSGATLTNATLTNTDLRNANLSGADLSGSTPSLCGGKFAGANLSGAHLPSCWRHAVLDLSGATLTDAWGELSMGSSTFSSPLRLVGARLENFKAAKAYLWSVVAGVPSSLPKEWVLKKIPLKSGVSLPAWSDSYLVLPNPDEPTVADYAGMGSFQKVLKPIWRQVDWAEFYKGIQLSGLNLSGADFTGQSLEDSDLSDSNLTNADLTSTDAGGTSAPTDLSAASALAARKGARLFRATLVGTTVTKAKLKFAGLAGVMSRGIKGKPTSLPSGWTLAGGFLIGPKANLSYAKMNGVDFGSAKLAGATLTGSNLTGARLSKASLAGVISSGVIGRPASLPRGWKLIGGRFVRG